MSIYKTPIGELKINFLGHGSLLMEWDGKNIYVDPYSEVCDYSGKPSADVVMLTHGHYDHLDQEALKHIVTPSTLFIVSKGVKEQFDNCIVLPNNDKDSIYSISVTAIPAYNVKNMNGDGEPFHPKGEGNGYLLDFSGFKVYISGDTEFIPEMSAVKGCDVAIMAKNLPYTMSDDEFVMAANSIKPKYLHPYHYFELDVSSLIKKLDTGIVLVTD